MANKTKSIDLSEKLLETIEKLNKRIDMLENQKVVTKKVTQKSGKTSLAGTVKKIEPKVSPKIDKVMAFNYQKGYKHRCKVYGYITDRIVQEMEKGVIPWEEPAFGFQNAFSKHHYTGMNLMLCNVFAKINKNWSVRYATQKQIEEKGFIVTNWKPIPIIFFQIMEKEDKETGKMVTFPNMRYFRLHNVVNTNMPIEKDPKMTLQEPNKIIKDAMARLGITFYRGGNIPCYSPSKDYIQVPMDCDIKSQKGLYKVLFHELVHATGKTLKRFSADITERTLKDCSFEELVAEIGSAYLCHATGCSFDIENTASYIANWKSYIQDDDRVIIKASSLAQKAVDYILGIERKK